MIYLKYLTRVFIVVITFISSFVPAMDFSTTLFTGEEFSHRGNRRQKQNDEFESRNLQEKAAAEALREERAIADEMEFERREEERKKREEEKREKLLSASEKNIATIIINAVNQKDSISLNKALEEGKNFQNILEYLKEENLLTKAILFGDLESVKVLIRFNFKADSDRRRKRTALRVALELKTEEGPKIAKFLIENGGDLGPHRGCGNTVLHLALLRGYYQLVESLVERMPTLCSIKNDQGKTALKIALDLNKKEIADFIYKNSGFSQGFVLLKEKLHLHSAVSNSQEDRVQYLLCYRDVDLEVKNKKGETALNLAFRLKNHKIINLLIEKILSPWKSQSHEEGRSLLHLAILAKRMDIASYLLSSPRGRELVKPDASGLTPLHLAAGKGCYNILRVLLASPVGLGLIDEEAFSNKETALHLAVRFMRLESVRLLVDHKANKKYTNKEGLTPWQVLRQKEKKRGEKFKFGDSGIIRQLLKR